MPGRDLQPGLKGKPCHHSQMPAWGTQKCTRGQEDFMRQHVSILCDMQQILAQKLVKAINRVLLHRVIHLWTTWTRSSRGSVPRASPTVEGGGNRRDAHPPHPCPGPPGLSLHQQEGVLLCDPAGHV